MDKDVRGVFAPAVPFPDKGRLICGKDFKMIYREIKYNGIKMEYIIWGYYEGER